MSLLYVPCHHHWHRILHDTHTINTRLMHRNFLFVDSLTLCTDNEHNKINHFQLVPFYQFNICCFHRFVQRVFILFDFILFCLFSFRIRTADSRSSYREKKKEEKNNLFSSQSSIHTYSTFSLMLSF